MKSREDYPYIYFFTEPNVVFVYKIVGEEYVTVSDLSEKGEWEMYELSPSDEFGNFNHEANIALVGRGYFLSQDDINFMAGKINRRLNFIIKGSTPRMKCSTPMCFIPIS